MKSRILSLAAIAAFALSAGAAEPLRLGPAVANEHKFPDWPEEVSGETVEHSGDVLTLSYAFAADGAWNGRAQVSLRDAAGRAVAGLRSTYDSRSGRLQVESYAPGQPRRVEPAAGRVEFTLPAGRYVLGGCRATCPQLPENDAVGGPVPQAITLQATVR